MQAFIVALLLVAVTASASAPQSAPAAPAADHHMHVRSESGTAALSAARKAAGRKVPDALEPVPAKRVIEALDRAGMEQGVVLSNAYLFGMPELDFEDEYDRVREENDYVAAQVSRYPDRLAGFYSVDPLADYALREIERCAAADRLTGLKLHLANSDLDLRDPGHVQRLASIFARANQLGQPVIVHLRTRSKDYGHRDAEIFIDRVLAEAPGAMVQIAHLGGWSGMDPPTRAVVDVFAEAMGAPDDGRLDGVWFDTAETIIPESRAGGRPERIEQVRAINARTAGAIRSLGVDRVLFGSDWGAPERIRPFVHALTQELPLADEEVAELADNRAPWLD